MVGGLRTDVLSRCSLISASNWRRLTAQLAGGEFIEIPATQQVCPHCEVGIFINHLLCHSIQIVTSVEVITDNFLPEIYRNVLWETFL